MIPAPDTSSGCRDEDAGPEEEEGGQQREGGRPDSIDQHPVRVEQARHDESTNVRGQHRLAPRRGGQGAQPEEDREQELDLGLAHAMAEGPDHEPHGDRQERDDRDAHGHEDDQQGAEVREEATEGKPPARGVKSSVGVDSLQWTCQPQRLIPEERDDLGGASPLWGRAR